MNGNIENGGVLKGRISGLKMIRGYSAYELALIEGYEGTVEEWLASLKGRGIKKIELTSSGYKFTYTDDSVETITAQHSTARVSEVELFANKWAGAASPYSQVVSIDGITERSQVDLTPSVEQLVVFHDKDLAFVAENEDGVVTVYAVGQKPTNDYVIQVTITEVTV